jgi:aminoglycoside phosphotransferase (APT) family kinase protein
LIGTQFPQLALGSLRLLAEGWDNAVYLVDGEWAFRFPQRSIAIAGVEREISVLPRLGPPLPLHVPAPEFIGSPSGEYPWPFLGARFIPGREIADADLTDAQLADLAEPLGRFLRTLHSPEVSADLGGELPADPLRRSDMTSRVPKARERLREVAGIGLWNPPSQVASWLDEAERLPTPAPSVVVHGDLHVRHVLVNDARAVSGIIDWGDLAIADPSVDLSLGWALFTSGAREAFLAAYGEVDAATRLRARVLALFLCAALATYGHNRGSRALVRASVNGLERSAQP